MCLLLAAYRLHPYYDLAVAANRDEQFARPTRAMDYWPGADGLLAGRDLSAGGTWLGVDPDGRFAAVTNFHETVATRPGQPSRGRLVADFLSGALPAREYLAKLEDTADDYAGFNLLCADRTGLWYASNREPGFAQELPPGIYGVSNHLLDTPWPKVERARAALTAWVDGGSRTIDPLRELLADRTEAASALPFPASSAPFIRGSVYGTRCATVVARGDGVTHVSEETFAPGGASTGRQRFAVASASR